MSTSTGKYIFYIRQCRFQYFCCILTAVTDKNSVSNSTSELQVLSFQIKCCTEKVDELNKEFQEMKKEVEATHQEIDSTRLLLTKITHQMLSTNV